MGISFNPRESSLSRLMQALGFQRVRLRFDQSVGLRDSLAFLICEEVRARFVQETNFLTKLSKGLQGTELV